MSPNLNLRMDPAPGMKKIGKANTLNLALQTSLVQDNLPLEVVPHIYIGSIHAAFNQEAIAERGITHILNASGLPATFPRIFTYLTIDLRDKEASNILACIPAAMIFIETALAHGSILIHCAGGRSRSAAFITAYLMTSRGWSFDKAISTVRHARPVVQVNKGFEAQLRAYGAQHCDVYAAQQMIVRQRLHVYVTKRQHALAEKEYYRKCGDSGRQPSMRDLDATFVEEEGEEEERDNATTAAPHTPMAGGMNAISASLKNMSLNLQDGRRVSGGMSVTPSTDRRGSAGAHHRGEEAALALALALPINSGRGVGSTRSSMDGAIISERRGSASSLLGGLGSPNKTVNTGLAPVAAVDALVETAEANFESFFGDSGRSLRRSQQPNSSSTRTPRGSHHRRGKTAGGTALPPIAPTDAPSTPTTPLASKMSVAFTESPPLNLDQGNQSIPLRSPFSSMSVLEQNTCVTPVGGGRVHFQVNAARGSFDPTSLGQDGCGTDADREARESLVMNSSNSNTPSRGSRCLQPPWNQGGGGHPPPGDAASLLAARNRFCSAPALPHLTNLGIKTNKHELHPQVPPTPHLRLSRPSSNSMQAMPPLQGLERTFVCSACNTRLFSVGNVMRVDLILAEVDPNLDVAVISSSSHPDNAGFDEEEDNALKMNASAPSCISRGSLGGRKRLNDSSSSRPTAMEGLEPSSPFCAAPQPIPEIPPLDSSRRTSLSRPLDSARSPNKPQDAHLPHPHEPVSHGGCALTGSATHAPGPRTPVHAALEAGGPPPHLESLTPSGKGSSARKLFGFDHQQAISGLASPSSSSSSNLPTGSIRSDSGRLLSPGSSRDADGPARDNTTAAPMEHPRTPTAPSVPNPNPAMISPRTTNFESPRRCSVTSQENGERRPSSPSIFCPGSPERKRWVGKMKQLEDGTQGERVLKALELDLDACNLTAVEDRWVPIEYMPWMGDLTSDEVGVLHCPNPQCKAEVGKFDWRVSIFPTSSSTMLSELPLFGIDKGAVTLCNTRGHIGRQNSIELGAPPSGESTPRAMEGFTPRDSVTSTPRLGGVIPGTPHAGSGNRRGSGGLNSPAPHPLTSTRQGSLKGEAAFSFGQCK